jgi:lysophospholipase L1-like esterase
MRRLLLAASLGLSLTSIAFGGGTITWPTPPLPPDANPAATASPPISGWLNYFEQSMQKARKMGQVDLIFDGDNLAITSGHYGPTGGMCRHFERIKAMDYANPGDTTQNILWRLQNGEADGLQPKLIVLMVGGSNLNPTTTPEQAAEGVKAVVAEYQKRCPDATILLCGVLPRGEKPTDPQRAKIKAINQIISTYGDGKKVIYLDFGDQLLQPDGTITKDVLFDFVHPGPKGYEIWAKAIQPTVDQFFPPSTLPPAPPEVAATNSTNSAASAQPPSAPEPIIGGGTVTWPAPPLPPGANSAIIPAPNLSWLPHLQQNIDDSRKMPTVDLIFDGDSITAGWRGGAGGLWNKRYGKLNAFDFGISGDTTSGLLWRVAGGGQVDGLHPKLVVLLIGTNNMYSSSVEQIAGGIKADIEAYEQHCPEATILVQGILPRGEQPTDGLRAKVKAVNQIVSGYADGKKVIYIDWGPKLLTPEGLYTKPMTGDFLHPQLPGYEIWADSIQPVVDQFLPPASASAPAPSKP